MKAYLSKMNTVGRYCLSEKLPIKAEIGNTGRFELYPQAGDVLWTPLLCNAVAVIAGEKAMNLKPFESIVVMIVITPLP